MDDKEKKQERKHKTLKEIKNEREKTKETEFDLESSKNLPFGTVLTNIPIEPLLPNVKEKFKIQQNEYAENFVRKSSTLEGILKSTTFERSDYLDTIEDDSECSSENSSPSPTKRKFEKELKKKLDSSFQLRNDVFRLDITRLARINHFRSRSMVRRAQLSERQENFNLYKRVTLLRYRDNAFKAAGKISIAIPLFPAWAYKSLPNNKLSIVTINVGGKKFQIFLDTLMSIPNSKLSICYLNHKDNSDMFFDRDSNCFNYIINFFRTGKLHAPLNSCLSFFNDELNFWGVNEDIMEPCCFSEYKAYKHSCNTLTMYRDNKGKPDYLHGKKCDWDNVKRRIYLISSGDFGVAGSWYSLVCGSAIIFSIITMVMSTSADGRIDRTTREFSPRGVGESLNSFFGRTDVQPSLYFLEMLLVGFFLIDLIIRFTTSPDKLLFFSDSINWIDFIATLSSLLSNLSRNKVTTGAVEAYILLMKMPRVLRLFRLTKNFRSGIDALVLTLRARSEELKLVFILTLITICTYGALIYVIELVNETAARESSFKTAYDGMWFAIVTMATVGYGDITPHSTGGYVVGFFCILTGIIISQLPVPIFLKDFSSFYTQIQSSERDLNKVLNQNIDPENFMEVKSNRGSIQDNFKKWLKTKRSSQTS